MSSDESQAAESLAAMQEARARLAAAADCPPERHFAFAAVMGVLVANPIVPLPWRFVVLVFVFAAIALIVRWDRRRTGMFINGYRRGATRWITFAMLIGVMSCYLGSCWLAIEHHEVVGPLIFALVATTLAYFGSIAWQRRFRREMGAAA